MTAEQPEMPRGDCGCRNHLGNPKIKYPDQAAALDAILRRHLHHGPHTIYRCPHMPHVLHITSATRRSAA